MRDTQHLPIHKCQMHPVDLGGQESHGHHECLQSIVNITVDIHLMLTVYAFERVAEFTLQTR